MCDIRNKYKQMLHATCLCDLYDGIIIFCKYDQYVLYVPSCEAI